MSCCGRIYCKACLEEYRKYTNSDSGKLHCPNCRKATYSFHNRRGSRNIKCLRVKCSNVECGCTWEGELLYLKKHVSECPYARVTCPNKCAENVFRLELRKHTENECPLRRYRCPDCGACSTYRKIVTKHSSECPEALVPCPNECGFTAIVRRSIASHLAICPNEKVSCTYSEIGCSEKILRKTVLQHESEGIQQHLRLATAAIAQLKQPIAVFWMREFTYHKANSKWWYSTGFYTHPGGYKLCLGVAAKGNGDGTSTYISAYIYRMKGENDDSLIWPFRGQVTFELLNQLQDSEHYIRTVPFDFHCSNEFNGRVLKGERSSQGWGINRFLPHRSLGYNKGAHVLYLKDDSLYFRVSSIQVYASNKPWLSCTSPV